MRIVVNLFYSRGSGNSKPHMYSVSTEEFHRNSLIHCARQFCIWGEMETSYINVFSENILIKSQTRANEKWCNGGAHDVKIAENLTECIVGVEETIYIYMEYGIVH